LIINKKVKDVIYRKKREIEGRKEIQKE